MSARPNFENIFGNLAKRTVHVIENIDGSATLTATGAKQIVALPNTLPNQMVSIEKCRCIRFEFTSSAAKLMLRDCHDCELYITGGRCMSGTIELQNCSGVLVSLAAAGALDGVHTVHFDDCNSCNIALPDLVACDARTTNDLSIYTTDAANHTISMQQNGMLSAFSVGAPRRETLVQELFELLGEGKPFTLRQQWRTTWVPSHASFMTEQVVAIGSFLTTYSREATAKAKLDKNLAILDQYLRSNLLQQLLN